MFACGLLLGLDFGSVWPRLCGTFSSTTSAAWAQAIGTFAAIGIAVYVPYRLAKQEEARRAAERQYRARLLASKLLSATAKLQVDSRGAIAYASARVEGRHAPRHPLPLDLGAISQHWIELPILSDSLAEKYALLINTVEGYNVLLTRIATLTTEQQLRGLLDITERIERMAADTYAHALAESALGSAAQM